MSNFNHLVSIVITVYNGEKYIKDCLTSLLNQTYKNIEIIVVDDGSIDNSLHKLKAFEKIDSRLKIIKNNINIGITKSLNIGIKKTNGYIIARQDIDEIATKDRIEKQVQYLIREKLVLVGSNCINLYPNGFMTEWGYYNNAKLNHILKYRSPFPHGTALFIKQIFLDCGGYDENYKTSQDYDLWIKIQKKGKIGMLNNLVLKRAIVDESISKNMKLRQAFDSTRIRIKNAHIVYLPQQILFSLFSLFISFLPNKFFYYYAKLRNKII